MQFSPFSALRQNIAATMAALSLTHADGAAFQSWLYSAWIDSGFVPHFAVLSQPTSSTTIQFDVRVGAVGRKVNVWWGDNTSNTYSPGTSSDTACAKTYGSSAVRPVVVIGSVKEFRSVYSDGRTAFGGRLQGFGTALTHFAVTGSNTLSGSVAGLTSLTDFYVMGSNTLSGSVTGLTSLRLLYVMGSNTLSGSVAGLTSLTHFYVTGSNTLSGSVAGMTSLTILYVMGSNTLTGWGAVAAAAIGLCYLSHGGLTVLDAAEINAVLAGFWANRDAAKSRSDRVIDIGKDTPTPNAAPTGQGIIDRDALRLYRSPTPPGTAVPWAVTTN